jgi:capsid protein
MLVDQYGRPMHSKRQSSTAVRARYDSAQTTDDNKRHWAAADSLSAVSANSAYVRKRLRERSRYEVANNSYARGILNTISAYTVGAGPTLQLTYRGGDESIDPKELRKATQEVEKLWANWAYARKLAQKLSTMQLAIDQDGEAFAMTTTASRAGMQTPVQLDLRLYEADHFDDSMGTDDAGVRIDANGEVVQYAFSKDHPGDSLSFGNSGWISADQVIHLFALSDLGNSGASLRLLQPCHCLRF